MNGTKNRNTRRTAAMLVVAAAAGLLAAAPARGQDALPPATPLPTKESIEKSDKALMNRLTRQVRRIDRETEKLMKRAMEEARGNGGQANPETKAELLSLRDERDRLFSRMLVLSMRHGWAIPDLDRSTAPTHERKQYEDAIFGSVDVLVQKRFTAEAQRIVAAVHLPVVSLPSMGR